MSSSRPRASSSRNAGRSLHEVMREPSTNVPDVVVVDVVEPEKVHKVIIDPKKDLWVSTVDGRHQSPIIPVTVGPHAEMFYIHRDVLLKGEYFRKALEGSFSEAEKQAVDLPEEDPSIFSFVVAFLYEGSYVPIKPLSAVLILEPEKGKGKDEDEENSSGSDSGSDTSGGSYNTARSRRRQEAFRRRQERAWAEQNRKEPDRHRPDCRCSTCIVEFRTPPCWNCGQPRLRPLPPPRFYPNGMPIGPPRPPPPGYDMRMHIPLPPQRHHLDRNRRRGGPNRRRPPIEEIVPEERMSAEDLRTWVMGYELNVDVYVCAERYLMPDFKSCIASHITDNLETAGIDAAQPVVLNCCKKLFDGVRSSDVLVKKIFARVGFLLARLWKNFPEETHAFWMENPEVGSLIMKETMERREEDTKDDLPPMNKMVYSLPPPPRVDHGIILIDD